MAEPAPKPVEAPSTGTAPSPAVAGAAPALPWLGATLAGALIPLAAVLLSGGTLVTRDTMRMFEPLRPLVVAALRSGRLPLWNPHEALGIPLFAQIQHGVLHPVSLLAALLAPSAGMDLFIVAHVLLAAGGAFVLARALGASPRGAAVTGLAYALSGYVLSMSCNLPYLAGAGTAPWALAAFRAAARGSRGAILGGAVAMAALLFAGDPQWAVATAGLGVALALEGGGIAGLARAAGAMALGGLVAAVQLLATWAYLNETSRAAEGLRDIERAQWALAPARLLELVAPGFFGGRPGSGFAQVFFHLGGPTTYGAPFVPSVHVGAAVLLLALLAVRASRTAKLLGGAVLLLLWLALGVHLGADQLLRSVPVWGSFRYSEKLVGPITLCLAALAGLGADRLAEARAMRSRLVVLIAVAVVVGLAVLVLAVGGDGLLAGAGDDLGPVLRERLLVGLSILLAGLALIAAAVVVSDRPRLHPLLPAAAVAIVLLQGVAAAPFAVHDGVRGVRDPDPLRAVRAPDELTRIATPARKGPAYGPASLDDADRSVFLESRMAVMPYGAPVGIDHVAPYSPLWPARYERVFFAFLKDFGARRWVAWRRFSLDRLVIDTRHLPDVHAEVLASLDGAQKLQGDAGLGFSVWEVPHRPWAAFAPAVIPASSEREAYDQLAAAISTGSEAVVVEGSTPLPASPGRVLAVDRGAERVRIEAESAEDGVLVVNDTWLPGWEASVDGRPVPLLRADVLVRAIAWPAGRHLLELRYAPGELRVGLALSALGALILAGVSAWWMRARFARDGRER